MASFARTGMARPVSRGKDERPPRRKKEPRAEIWSSLLRQTREAQARSRTQAVHHRELLVCGGSPDDQRFFVQSLMRPPPPLPPGRNREQRTQKAKGEMRLSNRFAYGYGHMILFSPPQQGVGVLGSESEEVARIEVHTIPEPELAYEQTLRRILHPGKEKKEDDEADIADAAEAFATGAGSGRAEPRRLSVAILLSWKAPWQFLRLLKRWLQLLARALLPPESPQEDPLEVLKEYGLSLSIIVQNVEAQEELEREGYKEERFDYISQCLRTCVLPLSAALVYMSSILPSSQPGSVLTELQMVLYTSMGLDLGPLSPAPPKGTAPTKREDLAPKHNVVDRMALVVPSGWDSVGKIRLLSETFSPEAILESWMLDLMDPLQTTGRSVQGQGEPKQEEARVTSEAQANEKVEQHEAEIYATSEAGDEEFPLHDQILPASKQSKSAISIYESAIIDPKVETHLPKEPTIEVVTKPDQQFLSEMRAHLQELEAHDAERAKNSGPLFSTTAGSLTTGRMIGMPSGDQTGALNDLGDVSFNVGGVNYNTLTAEAAIERMKRTQNSALESPSGTPRASTPRPPRREERDSSSTPVAPSTGSGKGELPVDKLEEYFASLMKKGGGGSAGSTPSKAAH